ncbi:hypothetical protein AAIR98_001063 [Elusimicrobium simillimum]|uniref:hypothetical protein n=1 Tax=Elusimicrobium simillimum TaxID=3143438 RepID=UPI003C6FFE5A
MTKFKFIIFVLLLTFSAGLFAQHSSIVPGLKQYFDERQSIYRDYNFKEYKKVYKSAIMNYSLSYTPVTGVRGLVSQKIDKDLDALALFLYNAFLEYTVDNELLNYEIGLESAGVFDPLEMRWFPFRIIENKITGMDDHVNKLYSENTTAVRTKLRKIFREQFGLDYDVDSPYNQELEMMFLSNMSRAYGENKGAYVKGAIKNFTIPPALNRQLSSFMVDLFNFNHSYLDMFQNEKNSNPDSKYYAGRRAMACNPASYSACAQSLIQRSVSASGHRLLSVYKIIALHNNAEPLRFKGNLISPPYTLGADKENLWMYHDATMIVVADKSNIYYLVLDYDLYKYPLTLAKWTEVFEPSKTVYRVLPYQQVSDIERSIKKYVTAAELQAITDKKGGY